eukprot:SAG25_NODE_2852_length_1351_cov_3.654952_1_plen_135_part_00
MLGGGGVKHDGLRDSPVLYMQRRGRPQLAAAADGYRYLRGGAMGEPGRPGPALERCPHDPHRGGQGRGSGRPRGQARARGACSHHARAASDENRIFIDSRRPISVVYKINSARYPIPGPLICKVSVSLLQPGRF